MVGQNVLNSGKKNPYICPFWANLKTQHNDDDSYNQLSNLLPNKLLYGLLFNISGITEMNTFYARDVRFGLKLGQIGTKWDKSETF